MPTRVLAFGSAAVLALSVVVHAGGWAVVTLEELPEQFVVGKATTLRFSVRQHGQQLIGGLSAGVSATSGSRYLEVAATPGEPGYYSATLTPSAPGEWTITIHSGFGAMSRVTLRPIVATAAAIARGSVTPAQRGEQLFIAKGCNGCHFHGRTGHEPIAPYGADLTDKRYPDALLSKVLANPSILPPTAGPFRMPNLNLRPQEIDALVAFINAPESRIPNP